MEYITISAMAALLVVLLAYRDKFIPDVCINGSAAVGVSNHGSDRDRDLSGGSFGFLGGLISGIGGVIGKAVSLVGTVGAVVPGIGPIVAAGANVAQQVIWPNLYGEQQGPPVPASLYPQVYGNYGAAQAGGTNYMPYILLAGGLVAVYLITKKRG